MIQLQRILWPTDLSPLSLQAGFYAEALAQQFGAQLHALHVFPTLVNPELEVYGEGVLPIATTQFVEAARSKLAQTVAEHFDPRLRVSQQLVEGQPWREICSYAQQSKIDLIVMATHGHTGFSRVLLGSTAERVVRHAHCPVLTVKSPVQDHREPES